MKFILDSISCFFVIVIPAEACLAGPEAGIQFIFSYSTVLDARFRGHDVAC